MRYLIPLDKLEEYISDNPLEVQQSYIKVVESDDSEIYVCMTLDGVCYSIITIEDGEGIDEVNDITLKELAGGIKESTEYIKKYEESTEYIKKYEESDNHTEDAVDIIDYYQAFDGFSSLLLDLGVCDEEIADNIFSDFCSSLESYGFIIT